MRLKEKAYEIDNRLISLKSKTITDMPRGGIAITRDDVLIEKEEILDRIESLNKISIPIRKEILVAIDTVENTNQAETLECFFIKGMTLEEIAEHLNYSVRQTVRIYGKAVRAIKI